MLLKSSSIFNNPLDFFSSKYFIRILALIRGKSALETDYFCSYSSSGGKLVSVTGIKHEIWGQGPHWDPNPSKETLRPFLISCPVPKQKVNLGKVGIDREECLSEVSLNIELNLDVGVKREFCVCVKPLWFEDDISKELTEFIGLSHRFGADKISIYIYHVHEHVDALLRQYENKGLVEIIPWQHPENQTSVPHDPWQKRRSEIPPLNHCLYNHLDSYKFVIPLDIDELLVPFKHKSWSEALSQVDLNAYTSFSARNFFAYKDHRNDGSLALIGNSTQVSEPGIYVKSFIQTSSALSILHHYAQASIVPGQKLNVNLRPDLILKYHFRKGFPDQ